MIIIIILLSLIVTSIGFYKKEYFKTIGYGFSIATIGLVIGLFTERISILFFIILLSYILYGIRICVYYLYSAYKRNDNGEDKVITFNKCLMWIGLNLLYILWGISLYFRSLNTFENKVMSMVGIIVMVLGFIIGLLADIEKFKVKRYENNHFMHTGIYKYVRCARYFGEIVFYLGLCLSSIGSLNVLQMILSVISFISLIYLMLTKAKRNDRAQENIYGLDSEYLSYSENTPIIIPFIKIYHLDKVKWIL